jgi:hypothetical protein
MLVLFFHGMSLICIVMTRQARISLFCLTLIYISLTPEELPSPLFTVIKLGKSYDHNHLVTRQMAPIHTR